MTYLTHFVTDCLNNLKSSYVFLCNDPKWQSAHHGREFKTEHEAISLYLSTSVMLLGLDFSDVDIVGIVRPFNMLHYVVQAAGGCGCNMGNGRRRCNSHIISCISSESEQNFV